MTDADLMGALFAFEGTPRVTATITLEDEGQSVEVSGVFAISYDWAEHEYVPVLVECVDWDCLTDCQRRDLEDEACDVASKTVCFCGGDGADTEGHACDKCRNKAEAYWAAYFGIRPGMTREQRAAQLERMKPHSDEDYRAAWALKLEVG